MNRSPLAALVNAADAVRAARKHVRSDMLSPVAEMIDCIRLARRWGEYPERAGIAAHLAAIWASDAIKGE